MSKNVKCKAQASLPASDGYAALVQKWRRRACRLYRRADKTTENAPNIYYRVAAQEAGKYARELAAELKKQHNKDSATSNA